MMKRALVALLFLSAPAYAAPIDCSGTIVTGRRRFRRFAQAVRSKGFASGTLMRLRLYGPRKRAVRLPSAQWAAFLFRPAPRRHSPAPAISPPLIRSTPIAA